MLLTDVSGKNAFQISERQAEELGVDDYLLPYREQYFNSLGETAELSKLGQDTGLLVANAMTTTDDEQAQEDAAEGQDRLKTARKSPDLMNNLESRLERIAAAGRSRLPQPRDDEQQLVFVDVEDASNTEQTEGSDS